MKKKEKQQKRIRLLSFLLTAALLWTSLFAPISVSATENTVQGRTSAFMDEETAELVNMAGEDLTAIASEREILALVYLEDRIAIRRTPAWDGEAVVTVNSGHPVNISDIYVDDEFSIWMKVNLEYDGREAEGFVPLKNLASSDTRYLNWLDTYGFNRMMYDLAPISEEGTGYADIDQFPESYRAALVALKEAHPNWIFAKFQTGMDWNDVISKQRENGKSLVHKSLPEWTKEGLYDNGSWYYASKPAVEMYMDPRNGLTEERIFQFEQLTYNEEYHSFDAVKAFLNQTFMNDSKNAPGTGMTYATIFWALAKEEGRKVSPFHLVTRVLQEQGTAGTSPLISGTVPGFEGWYNYFNIGATGSSNEEYIINGLTYAKANWGQGAYYAIMYGADFVSGNYIKKGQDTLYLQKYNVNPNGYYSPHTHQYMQNISAPTTESMNIKKLYAEASALDSPFVFKIPVYENMPAEACGEPQKSNDITLTLPQGYTDTTMWLDGVAYTGEIKDGKLTVTAPDDKVQYAVVYEYKENGAAKGMSIYALAHDGWEYTATEQTALKDLLTYHGFSIRVTGKAGIRVKTGISTTLREQLTTTGADGYRLKEYGTLVMKNSNRETYPMIKGGEKVQTSMAYGTTPEGLKDVVFETKEDRYRYTAVLVGLPADQYKTEFAFRGYAVLEKDGKELTIYGPVSTRSIYDLAKQALDANIYNQESTAYQFLQQLVADADALSASIEE